MGRILNNKYCDWRKECWQSLWRWPAVWTPVSFTREDAK